MVEKTTLLQPEHIIGRNAPTDPQPRHLGWTTLDLAWVSGRHCLFKLLEADPASGKELVVTLTDTVYYCCRQFASLQFSCLHHCKNKLISFAKWSRMLPYG
jgi:hypothetical protein